MVEFDELLITTGVDALVRLVKDRQKIELEEATSTLNIPKETIEEWSRVLEEEGILRIEYRLTRVYLIWIKPTEEELQVEKEELSVDKKELEKQIEEFKARSSEKTHELEQINADFEGFYNKITTKLDALQKSVGPVKMPKFDDSAIFEKQQQKIDQAVATVQKIKSSIEDLRRDIDGTGITSGITQSTQMLSAVEKTVEEMNALQKEMDALKESAKNQSETASAIGLPAISDLKKKFDLLKKELTDIRSRNSKMRDDVRSIGETTATLQEVYDAIKDQESTSYALKDEMTNVAAQAQELLVKVQSIAERSKNQADLLERYSETIKLATSVVSKFPNQQAMLIEIQNLENSEVKLVEKMDALEKIMAAVGGKQVGPKQFADLSKKMDERMRQVRIDLDSLGTALEDERATYLAFQKISDRISSSITNYQKQLESVESDIIKVRQDALSEKDNLKQEAIKIKGSLAGTELQQLSQISQEIEEKRALVDEIRHTIEDMRDISENLNKKATLLLKEAKVLEIRSDGTQKSQDLKKEEIRKEIELTKAEEEEFKKKREELKGLIKKLWEE
ncbi:MAG: hypothetical protein ACP5N9_06135 [Candidatus Bilamarchaeum sp.]